MGIEFELKYRATPGMLEKLREEFSQDSRSIAMETTYYDTPEGALSALRYTLRRRTENGISVCTLKTPADGPGRQEYEVLSTTIEDALERLGNQSGIDLLSLTEDGLVPVCGARFSRVAKDITFSNTTVELAMDKGVLIGGDREVPLHEVEVELKSGSRETAKLYAAQLALRYNLVPEAASKFRRALELARGEQDV